MLNKICSIKKRIADQAGMVAVEVILSLVIFSVAMLGLVNFINIYMVHNKVQYAINCAANEIASYSYLYSALNIKAAEQKIQSDFGGVASMDDEAIMGVVDSYNKINTLTGNVSNTYNDIQNFELSTDGLNNIVSDMNAIKDSGTATIDSVKATREKIGACFEDPKGTLAGFIYLAASGGITAGKSFIGEALARTLTKGFISNDYLLSYGVKNGYEGLDFGGSSIFCGENKNMIDIEVRYDIEIGFLGLLIADPTVHVVQRVTIPAWLDGDGKRVEDCIGE